MASLSKLRLQEPSAAAVVLAVIGFDWIVTVIRLPGAALPLRVSGCGWTISIRPVRGLAAGTRTTRTDWLPVMVALAMSVTVTVWVPGVLSVIWKVWLPASAAVKV